MAEVIVAPCQPDGVVKSVWPLPKSGKISSDDYLYAVPDDEAKDAECRCKLGTCCVNGKNHVITGIAFNLSENNK